MAKHAYCILAHNEPEIFATLISLLDHPDNDIFIHIDKSTEILPFKKVQSKYSRLNFSTIRRKCRWGTSTMIEVELQLLQEARQSDDYLYYHILSGVDLPIQSQEYIHRYMDKLNSGYNYIGFAQQDNCSKAIEFRTSFYHFIVRRPEGNLWNKMLFLLNMFFIKGQQLIHIHRKFPFRLYKGSQWASITTEFCNYLCTRADEIIKAFRWTRCADELFLQSVFMDSPYSDTLFNPNSDEFEQCMREIDWKRGGPYTWSYDDFEYLLRSNKLFARKFSSKEQELIQIIRATYKS